MALGGRSVAETLEGMDAREYLRWKRYELENGPLGPQRLDILAAQIAYYVVAAMGGKKAIRGRKLSAFVLNWGVDRGDEELSARDRRLRDRDTADAS